MPDPPNNTPIWARIVEREIMYHGPLPATVHVKKAVHVNKPAYHVEIPGQSDSIILDCHPLSPRGRTALGANLAKLPIESLGTKELPCVGLPPVELKHSDWEWTKPVQDERVLGLVRTILNYSGSNPSTDQLQEAYNMVIQDPWNASNPLNLPHHPSDRGLYVPWAEVRIARICDHFQRSLIIFGPRMTSNGGGWRGTYQHLPKNRPAVGARWAAGTQEIYKPAFVGFVPSTDFEGEKVAHRIVYFAMKPSPAYLNRYNTPAEAQWRQFATRFAALNDVPHTFINQSRPIIEAGVAAHRSYLLRDINDRTKLGEWIHRFILFKMSNPANKTNSFLFKSEDSWKGPVVSLNELSLLILCGSSTEGSPVAVMARRWDIAMRACAGYLRSKTMADFETFQKALKEMQT